MFDFSLSLTFFLPCFSFFLSFLYYYTVCISIGSKWCARVVPPDCPSKSISIASLVNVVNNQSEALCVTFFASLSLSLILSRNPEKSNQIKRKLLLSGSGRAVMALVWIENSSAESVRRTNLKWMVTSSWTQSLALARTSKLNRRIDAIVRLLGTSWTFGRRGGGDWWYTCYNRIASSKVKTKYFKVKTKRKKKKQKQNETKHLKEINK